MRAPQIPALAQALPSGIAYKFDAADNLVQNGTSQQQAFNNADELCWTAATTNPCATPPSGASTYQYDSRGNRAAFNPSGGQAQTFNYDQANRLSSFTVAASTTTYGYNADGLRMCKLAASSSSPCTSPSANQFVWDAVDGDLVLKDGATAYVYGPGGLPVEQITAAATYYFHHDQIGSTRLVTTSAGATQATYTFNPFGKLVASTGSLVNPLLYTAQYLDSETSLYYLRARYYDPSTGQFLSRDPATESTREPYGYVLESPLNGTDPAGLDSNLTVCNIPIIGSLGQSIGYCPGQQPGGGQLPIRGRPEPPKYTPPVPVEEQDQACGCMAVLFHYGNALPLLFLGVVASSQILFAQYGIFDIGARFPILNAEYGSMVGEGTMASTVIGTQGWGPGPHSAFARVTVYLATGHVCQPVNSNLVQWSQTSLTVPRVFRP